MTATASNSASSTHPRDLAVAWMNRGHELMLQSQLAPALEAYGEAIARLRPLVAAGSVNPSWVNSLGAALMNRGHLLHRLHGVAQATLALEAFEEAATLLAAIPETDSPWPRRNLAGTLLNRANLLLDLGLAEAALHSAIEALALARPHECAELVDADLALKARRARCDAIGRLIVAPGADQPALASEASDLVDDALAVTRHWAAQGQDAFAPLALRFFRYGAQLYRLNQPHFLAEFIRENLPATVGEFHAIAREVLDVAIADRPADRAFLTIGDPVSERHLRTACELRELRASLSA